MIVQLTNSEFQQLRCIVQNLRSNIVTNEFNLMFTNSANGGNSHGSTGFVNTENNNEVVIYIQEPASIAFLNTVREYSPEFGNMMKMQNVGLVEGSRILGVFREFITKLRRIFGYK